MHAHSYCLGPERCAQIEASRSFKRDAQRTAQLLLLPAAESSEAAFDTDQPDRERTEDDDDDDRTSESEINLSDEDPDVEGDWHRKQVEGRHVLFALSECPCSH